MGDKASARATMIAAGVPVTPGSDGVVADAAEAEEVARRIGLPVMVKATAGGGGKGIRIVHEADALAAAVRQAQAEAQNAFGNGAVYVERYIEAPRHVEIQVLADAHGNVVHLGERDCSIQRRHQKLIEEAPSPAVDPDAARRHGQGRRGGGARRRLRGRRHGRVPPRHDRLLLLHGDEHARAGRAPASPRW